MTEKPSGCNFLKDVRLEKQIDNLYNIRGREVLYFDLEYNLLVS